MTDYLSELENNISALKVCLDVLDSELRPDRPQSIEFLEKITSDIDPSKKCDVDCHVSRLPHNPSQCYCPGHLEPNDPVQDFLSVPLPLPPLPLESGPAGALSFPIPYDTLYPYPPVVQKPRVWTVFVALAVLAAGLVVGGMVPVMMVVAENGGKFENPQALTVAIQTGILRPTILLSSGAATQAMLLVTALSAAILSPVRLVRRLRLNPSTLSPLGYIIAPIGALAVSVLFSNIITLVDVHVVADDPVVTWGMRSRN